MSNPLLTGVSRRIEPIKLPNSGRDLHVRQLTARELLQLEEAISAAKGEKHKALEIQIAAYVSDASGVPLLVNEEEAKQFIDLYSARDVARLVGLGDQLNSLSDTALESERKN